MYLVEMFGGKWEIKFVWGKTLLSNKSFSSKKAPSIQMKFQTLCCSNLNFYVSFWIRFASSHAIHFGFRNKPWAGIIWNGTSFSISNKVFEMLFYFSTSGCLQLNLDTIIYQLPNDFNFCFCLHSTSLHQSLLVRTEKPKKKFFKGHQDKINKGKKWEKIKSMWAHCVLLR